MTKPSGGMLIRRLITELFSKANRERKIKRLPVVRGATECVTIRMRITDTEAAHELAEQRGVPYQTLMQGLLHEALEHKHKAG